MTGQVSINIREATQHDAGPLCQLLNEIIIIGGSTAFQSELGAQEFADYFLSPPSYVICNVAENPSGLILSFQSLLTKEKLPVNWVDIATFAQASDKTRPKVRGVGSALFEQTLKHAHRKKLAAINATIRADNVSGLAYYAKMGFEDYSVAKAVLLKDGTPIDRISKTYSV